MELTTLVFVALTILIGLMLTELLARACEITMTWTSFVFGAVFWGGVYFTAVFWQTPVVIVVFVSFFLHLYFLKPTGFVGMNHGALPPNWYK